MNSKFKRLLACLLSLMMVVSLFPMSAITAFAAEADENATVFEGNVAKVGNTEYATIDEAIAAWTNGTTLTLLADVTLSDVVTLKSTEHHILNLSTYTMTAASGKNAFVIQACGTGSAERSTITINADATNPGGINAGNKCVVYYKYADGGISTEDRPIIKINGGVFTGSTSSWGTTGIYTIGTAARKCATLNISGGTFNCSIYGSGKSKLLISGGTFNYSVGSQGDSTALRLISGGKFKTLGFMTADSNNTKFWFGTSMANSDVGLFVDAEGYLNVGGPVITELSAKYPAVASNATKWSSYLAYSSAATYGLFYEDADMAIANHGEANVTVEEKVTYVAEVGEQGYETLAAAINAATTGQTVKLLNDITLTDDDIITVGSYKVMANVDGKNITLDMNGKKITVNYAGGQYLYAVIRVADGASLTVTGDGAIDIPSNGINVAYMFWKAGTTGTLNVKNGTYHMDNSADSMVYTNGHEIVTIEGGTWTLDAVGTRENRFPCFFNVQGAGDHSIIVKGGTYNDDINNQHWGNEAVVPATHYVVNNGNGTWTVKTDAVASVNLGTLTGPYFVEKEFGFATFEEAWAAAGDGNTITLLQDVTLDTMLVNTKKITLNLNGKTITGTDNTSKNFSLIDNRGELTITGNGKMTLIATVNSGWNRYSAVIANNPGGKLIIENGTIEHLGGTDMAYGIDNLTNGKGTYAETIINGGTIKSTYRGIRQFLNGVEAQNILTINGGTVEGANKAIFFHDPSTKANSGTITVAEAATINGGVYLFVTEGSTEWPVTVSIAASAVNGDVTTKNVPEGYVVENKDGTYGVRPANYVVSVNGVKYESLAAAIKAATAGDTIIFLADVNENVTINKNLTIDGNGKTYIGTMTVNDKLTVTVQNVNFVNGGIAKTTKSANGNYTVKGCTFTDNGKYAYALSFKGANTITVENCTASNYMYSFLYVSSGTNNVSVKNVTVENCPSYAVYFASGVNTASFENLTVKNSNNGFIINNTANRAFTVKNCTMENVGTAINHSNGSNTIICNVLGVNDFGGAALSQYVNVVGVQVGTKIYDSLANAWAAAQDGDTIKLLGNIAIDTETFTVADGKKVTLDMNGKKITVTDNATKNYELFYIYGEMVVTGNGTIELTSTNNRAWNAMSAIFHNRGGVLTIENGTYTNFGGTDMAWVVDNSGNYYGDAVTNINGGTLISSYIAIRNRMEQNTHGASGKAILNVYGGKIDGTSRAIWAQAASTSTVAPATGEINVYGGEIGLIDTARNAGAVSMTTITGGTVAAFKGESGELTVNGGSITGDVTICFADGTVAEKAIIKDNVYYAATAKSGANYYLTLAEAIADAKNGAYVYLLHDMEGEGIVIDKDINIVLNGFTYTFVEAAVGSANTQTNGFQILKGHKVTISNGTLKVADSAASKYAMLIQNYSDLILRNMTLDGTNLDYSSKASYTLSINCGRVQINNGTKIIGNDRNLAGDYAIDVYDYSSAGYALPILELGSKAIVEGKISAAAKSGKYYYASLQQAIESANSIELCCDYEGKGVVIDKDVNINLAGYTFTVTEGVGSNGTTTNGFQILKGYKVSFRNGTIKVADSAASKIAILIQNYADLTLSNVVLDGTNLDRSATQSFTLSVNSGNVVVNAGSKILGNDRNLAGDFAMDVYDYSSAGYELPVVKVTTDVVIEGKIKAINYSKYYYSNLQQVIDNHGTANLMSDFEGAGVVINKNATINFNGYTYTFTSGVGSKGTESNGFQVLAGNRLTLNNGTLKVADSAANKFYILVQNYADLTLNSMTLDGTNLDKWSKTDGDSYTLSNNSGNVMINGTSKIIANNDGDKAFAFDVCDKSAWGYELPKVKVAATATIEGKIEAAAKIGNKYYATLAQAIADRENTSSKDELVLLSNIDLEDTLVIPTGKAIVLDLNGFTISQEKACTAHYAMIVNNNKSLTIKDSVGGGKITFKDTGAGDPNFGWGSYTIENKGQLILLSGTIENATELNSSKVVHMYCAIHQNVATAHTQIRGGVVSTPTYRSIRINQGNLTITGGEIDGQVWIHPFADGIRLNVSGGSFSPNGVDSSSIYVENSSKTVKVSVTGGEFATKIGCANADALKGVIRGGVFTDAAYENTNATLFNKNFVR